MPNLAPCPSQPYRPKGADDASAKKGSQSIAQKKLAKTNVKGMKSMASFFGAPKPKKS